MTDGWEESASAWIADMGDRGDYGRRYVLDAPMLALALARKPVLALDVGCGEGRFCRMLRAQGAQAIGVDPTLSLIEHARALDPRGDYRTGRAEALEFPDASFDLVISYLTLIDIPDLATAVAEMARVLKPGGRLLIANLTSFNTAGMGLGWIHAAGGRSVFGLDNYLDERVEWVSWRGISIENWHRPLSTYMSLLLSQGLILTHFSEPSPRGGDARAAARYRRAPWFMIMEWEKPARSASR